MREALPERYRVLVDLGVGLGLRQGGHHSAAFTLSVYTHMMPAADDRARQAISSAWAGSSDGPATAQGVRDDRLCR